MVGPGKRKASNPKIIPKMPRSRNSHQFLASIGEAESMLKSALLLNVVLVMSSSKNSRRFQVPAILATCRQDVP
ncbi:hypothetical protein XH98_22285 [Bradyrhizobium sp. CCBAU 51745]|nr:hypothetical protein [Bradyrhizobium sp. CCBAU 51745]